MKEQRTEKLAIEIIEQSKNFIEKNQLDKAEDTVRKILELIPDHKKALDLLEKIQDAKEREDDKKEPIELGLDNQTGSPQIGKERTKLTKEVSVIERLHNKAKTLTETKKYGKAKKVYQEILLNDPENELAADRIRNIFELEKGKKEEEVQLLLKKGNKAAKDQLFEEAYQHFRNALKIVNGHREVQQAIKSTMELEEQTTKTQADTLIDQGLEYLQTLEIAEGKECLDKALVLIPDYERAQIVLRRLPYYMEKKREKEITALIEKTDELLEKEEIEAAQKIFDEALELSPRSYKIQQGIEKLTEVKKQRARRVYKEQLTKAEENMQKGKLKEARSILQNLLKNDRQNSEVAALISQLYLKEQQVLKRETQALVEKSHSLLDDFKLGEALELLEKAKDVYPDSDLTVSAYERIPEVQAKIELMKLADERVDNLKRIINRYTKISLKEFALRLKFDDEQELKEWIYLLPENMAVYIEDEYILFPLEEKNNKEKLEDMIKKISEKLRKKTIRED